MKRILSALLGMLLLTLCLCPAQAEVSLPGALSAIRDQAFEGDTAFSGVIELPSGVRVVGNQAFKDTNIFGLKLPAAVRSIGEGILESSGTTYAIVGSASPVLADGAFKDVDVIVGRGGGSVESWAYEHGVSFYDMTMLSYSGGFAYQYERDRSVTLAFPVVEHTGAVKIPAMVNGFPVTHVSANAFTNLTGVTAISLPDTVEGIPFETSKWPNVEISYYPANPSQPVLPPEAGTSPHRVTRMEMGPSQITLNIGEKVEPEMIDPPVPSWRRNCTWVSSDEHVASVDANGVVTAIGEGTASITATVRVVSRDEVATPGEALPTHVYYGVTIVTVEESDLAVHVFDNALSLSVGQGYYPSYDILFPSRLDYPTVSFAYADSLGKTQDDTAPVVKLQKIGDGALYVEGCAPGTATVTVTAQYADRTAAGTIEIKVAEPQVAVNFPSLMTYRGYAFNLRVTSALPEGAAVAWASDNADIASVDENGHARIVGVGETAITCTVTDAAGKVRETVIPVSAKSGFEWEMYPEERELIAGWEYHKGFEDIMPWYALDLWPHDGASVSFSATSSDQSVLSFVEYDGGLVARAGNTGEARATYTATIRYPEIADATPPKGVYTVERPVWVVLERIVAHLSEDQIDMAVGEVRDINCWWESDTDLSSQRLYSTNPNVFTVTAHGRMTAQGAGDAELVYVIEAYGERDEVRAHVHVEGWEIAMEPEDLTLQVGQSASILARMVLPGDEGAEVDHFASHYTSNNEDIARVDELGLVTAVGVGTTVIDYETFVRVPGAQEDGEERYMRVRAYCEVHVTDPNADPSKAITFRTAEGIEPENGVLMVYPRVLTELQAYDSRGNRLENVTWECLPADGGYDWAFINEHGRLFPNDFNGDKAERRYVRAMATIGGEEVSALLTIDIAEPPARIDFCYVEGSILQVGETRPVTISLAYPSADGAGSGITTQIVSMNPDIVSITADGNVKAEKAGIAGVSVLLLDARGVAFANSNFNVLVATDVPAPGEDVTIEFDQPHYYVATENGRGDAYADVTLSQPELRDFYPITYVSGNPKIVNIEEDGHITHNGVTGTANIYAYIGDYTGANDPVAVAQVTVGRPEVIMTILHEDGSNEQMVNGGETDLTVGDRIQIEVTGLPDSESGVGDVQIWLNYNNWTLYLSEQSDTRDYTRLTAINTEDYTDVYVNIGIGEGWWHDFGFTLHVREKEMQEGEYRLDCGSLITLALDEEWALWPGFSWREVKDVRSSDDSVVQVSSTEETPIAVRGMKLGRSTVTASCLLDDGETWVPVSCEILVVENPWELRGLGDLPQIMIVGERYEGFLDVFHLSRSRPETIVVSSDPESLAAEQSQDNPDRWILHALKAGQYTLTLTAIDRAGVQQTLTVPVTVVQPQAVLSPRYVNCRPGASQLIQLRIAENVAVKSVTWTSDNERIASIQPVKGMQSAALLTVVPSAVQGNRALITAEVTLEGGSVLTASCWAQVIGDHDVWINVWFDQGDYREICMGDEERLEARVDANAEISNQYFASSDERIVGVDASGRLYPRKPGVATITYTAESYGRVASAEATVRVVGPEASLNKTELALRVGESEYLVPSFEEGAWVDPNSFEYVSCNESVARVDHLGRVTAVGAGKTTIRLRVNVNDTPVLLSCAVTVTGEEPKLQITLDGKPVTSVTTQPRQELDFDAMVSGKLTGSVTWGVSDSNWMQIDDEGRMMINGTAAVTDLSTVYISASAKIDGVIETAVCEIVCLPAEVMIDWAPNFYEVGVGQTCTFKYVINSTDPSRMIVPEFISTDPKVATIAGYPAYEDGAGRVAAVITGVSRGVCMVRLNLRDTQGKLLTTGAAYVYVDTPIPSPADDGVEIAFEQKAYYLPVPENGDEIWSHAGIVDESAMWIFDHPMRFRSDDEGVVQINENGDMQAIGEGRTTIHAWFEGYEDETYPHASAEVVVGRGELKVSINGKPAKRGWEEDDVNAVQPGDIVTLEMADMPENVDRHWHNWEYDGNFFHLLSESVNRMELVVRGDWESDVRIRTAVAPNGYYFEDGARFRSTWKPTFGMTYVRANVGETIDLWPNFGWHEIKDVKSGNRAVAQIVGNEECPVRLTAVGLGETEITARVLRDDGETWATVSCRVEVVEAAWRLWNLDGIESVMQVGQLYEPWAYVEWTGFYGPEQHWEISDESVLHIVDTDEGPRLEPLKRGQVTLTVTATMGGESQSLSKTITVTEPKIWLERNSLELRPGASLTVPLHVTVSHDRVTEITVASSNAELATAELVTLEDGEPAARITGVGRGGDTRVTAQVRMTDGSVLAAVCEVHVTANEEVWVNAHSYDIELSTEEWGGAPHRSVVWQFWDHNASHFDEPHNGEGTDTAWIDWWIDDESIAYFDGTFFRHEDGTYAPWNNGPMIVGLKEGDTTIHTRLTLRDAQGNYLAESGADFPVHVRAPYVELFAPNDGQPVELRVGEGRYLDWGEFRDNTKEILSRTITVADPSIAEYDMHGNITALKPGQTEILYTLTFVGGHRIEGKLPLTVFGPTIALAQKEFTVGVGETFDPGLTVNSQGWELFDQHWENSNEQAVAIVSDNTIYGLAPGQAQITYFVRFEDDSDYRATAMVTVTGKPQGFALSESALTLFAEQTAQLTAAGVSNAVWTSSDEDLVSVDENGRVTAGSFMNRDTRFDATAIITCTGTKNGERVSASCHVTVRRPKVRIAEHQFGEGRWAGMRIGDEEGIWEQYIVCDSSVTVTRVITVDDENVAEYDERYNVLRAVGEGHTYAHYTVTTSEGETHTRDLLIRVNENCWPDSITPEFGTFIVPLQWNQHYLPLLVEPAYTGIYLECTSSDEDIVAFDEGLGSTEMYFHGGTGLVTIDVNCPEKPELSTQAKVLVVDEENLPFTLEAEGGETVLTPGQMVQLVVRNSFGLDLSDEIREFRMIDEPDMWGVYYAEGNRLTVTANESSTDNGAWAHVELSNGWGFDLCYAYSVDAESKPYFFLRQGGGVPGFTLAPGSGTYLDVITNQEWTQEELAFSSDHPEIATVEWGEDEYAGQLLVIGRRAGQATITATLHGITSAYPITVIVPTEIHMGTDNSLRRNVVMVGEEFEMYTGFEQDWDDSIANFDRRHEYTSSDPSVLQRLDILKGEDPDGRHWMTMRALKPGKVTITVDAWLENYPSVRDKDTITFTVIPAK